MSEYFNRVKKNKFDEGLGSDTMQQSATSYPSVDFNKPTLGEQMLESSKTYEDVGGKDVNESPSSSLDLKSGVTQAGVAAAKGGSGADVLGSGLIATGHPAAIAAGIGLMALSNVQKNKQARRNLEYQEAVKATNQRRENYLNLANLV